MFIDTHTHLNFQAFEKDWKAVVDQAVSFGVEKMIVVGTDLNTSERAVMLAEKNKHLFAGVGIHPHHTRQWREVKNQDERIKKTINKLKVLVKHPRVVAIGEVGLDYHIYRNSKRYKMESSEVEWKRLKNLQKRLLGVQIQIAKKVNKPMIIHSREAGEDVLDVIEHFSKSDGRLPKGVWHCFDGSKKYLKKILEAGFYISFTGNITYSHDRAEVAKQVPLDRLLLETDSPYLKLRHALCGNAQTAYSAVSQAGSSGGQAPVNGERPIGLRCEPKDVKIIASFHAKQRGINVSEIERLTTKNAYKLFSGLVS